MGRRFEISSVAFKAFKHVGIESLLGEHGGHGVEYCKDPRVFKGRKATGPQEERGNCH